MNLIDKTINGMKIVGKPQRSGVRGSNYKYPCECVLCGNTKQLTLQSLRERNTYGCGCSVDGLITKRGKSFAEWCVENKRKDLLDLWDYELNDVSPDQVSSHSQKLRWFKCEHNRHESFLYSIPNLTRRSDHECFCKKCNSFAQHFIDRFGEEEFKAIWDCDNSVDPWVLNYGSKQPIMARCINDNSHPSYLTNAKSLMRGRRCPDCAKYIKTSKLQKLLIQHINDCYQLAILNEYDCSLVCINPKTKYRLPYDNEIIVGGKRLIVEVHGEQHYIINMWHKLIADKYNLTPEYVLQEQQWRDEYKKQYAIKQGYEYLAVPYWTEQDQSYKQLIDNKIHEILSNTTK